MDTYPNQKTIIIQKEKTEGRQFSLFEKKTANKALKDLRANTFKLWYFLAANGNSFEVVLSMVVCCEKCGFSKNTYRKGLKELEEKGYLRRYRGNTWVFSESAKFGREKSNLYNI